CTLYWNFDVKPIKKNTKWKTERQKGLQQQGDAAIESRHMNERHEEIASTLTVDLDNLPRLHRFRLRGMQMTRLETFIDAAFAFAISMLVIAAQQIPDNIEALLAAFKNVPTFACSIHAP